MPATPQITLTANLESIVGGTEDGGGSLIITLCGFGAMLPAVPGTGILCDAGIPQQISQVGSTPISIELFGNDVIEPLNQTFYDIAVLDPNGNIVQRGTYQFTGTEDIDLSELQPTYPSPLGPSPSGYVNVSYASAMVFNGYGWGGPIVFDVTLTGNVASSTVLNLRPGQQVQFLIRQDATGNRTFVWPANFVNPPGINPTASQTTTVSAFVDNAGVLRPQNGWNGS